MHSSGALALEAFELFRGLEKSDVVTRQAEPFEDNRWVHISGDLLHELALNQPLAPFALAYLTILDTDSPDYPLQVLSVVESIVENPIHCCMRSRRNCEMSGLRYYVTTV